MSDKMTCPVCGSHTSGVFSAAQNGDPCPRCGAPADVILRVDALRETRADEALKAELERTVIELGRVTAERDQLAVMVEAIRMVLSPEERDQILPEGYTAPFPRR
jgi:hypothetical protein